MTLTLVTIKNNECSYTAFVKNMPWLLVQGFSISDVEMKMKNLMFSYTNKLNTASYAIESHSIVE